MAILDDSFYPVIRAALHTSVTSTMLPDTVIEYDIYLGAAEAEVIRRDPDAEDRTGDELTHIQNAVVLLTAAYLAPSMELMQSEYIPGGGYRYQRPEVNWTDKATMLRQRADSELAAVLTPDTVSTASRPTFFGLARRGYRPLPVNRLRID